MLIYIAGPYRAPTPEGVKANVANAAWWAHVVAAYGFMPVTPHLLTHRLDLQRDAGRPGSDEFWLANTLDVMRRCDAVLLMPGWRASEGCQSERREADRLGLPVIDMAAAKEWELGEKLRDAATAVAMRKEG